MNTDFLYYKPRFITCALLLGYTFLHVVLTGTSLDVPFAKLIDFSIRFPFAQRILIPCLVYPFSFLPIALDKLFFLAEWLSVSLLYFSVNYLLRYEFNLKEAQLLSWLFILLLPLVTVINYRYTIGGEATFFYPSDTPSLLFTALGFLLCLRSQWLYFIPLVFLATVNRESSILLVLLIPALHWQRLKEVIKPMILAFLVYITARIIILSSLVGVPGKLMEWVNHSYTHFDFNSWWLLNDLNFLLFSFCFAGLPLFWFGFYDYIPENYKPIRYVALFYFIGLLLVGNFLEARIFGELVVLLYLPVCVGLRNWLSGLIPGQSEQQFTRSYIYYLSRYSILACFALIVIFRVPLNQLILWCINNIHLQ